MSAKNHGGPAFPVKIENRTWNNLDVYGVVFPPRSSVDSYGLSVRQLYAAHALAGILASDPSVRPEIAAQKAFQQADIMIEEAFK